MRSKPGAGVTDPAHQDQMMSGTATYLYSSHQAQEETKEGKPQGARKRQEDFHTQERTEEGTPQGARSLQEAHHPTEKGEGNKTPPTIPLYV